MIIANIKHLAVVFDSCDLTNSGGGSDERYDFKSEYRNPHKTLKTAIISQLLIIVIMLTNNYYILVYKQNL